ncbi:MAG: biotin--[Lachnospiraceae bacterium]|nr:biotin--[acetyl-CoA-carboxylase] ligase [Lachnospiraceae bacterium]
MVNEHKPGWAGKTILHEAQMDSTNEEAKRAGNAGADHGTVYRADVQSAGKGRRGRSWYSHEAGNLYFSILLRPAISPDKASMLTLVMAYAVAGAIREYIGLPAQIKWPNDIVVNDKKVCGILCEMKLDGTRLDYCVAGVGVNVGKQEFAEEIRSMATSLEEQLGGPIDREGLLQAILGRFERGYEEFLHCEDLSFLREEYNEWLANLNRQVRVLEPQGAYEGMSKGITSTGELLVECPDGQVQKVYAGEVSVRGLYGYV